MQSKFAPATAALCRVVEHSHEEVLTDPLRAFPAVCLAQGNCCGPFLTQCRPDSLCTAGCAPEGRSVLPGHCSGCHGPQQLAPSSSRLPGTAHPLHRAPCTLQARCLHVICPHVIFTFMQSSLWLLKLWSGSDPDHGAPLPAMNVRTLLLLRCCWRTCWTRGPRCASAPRLGCKPCWPQSRPRQPARLPLTPSSNVSRPCHACT